MLNLDDVRAEFPALRTDWALMDNAGGSAPCRAVIERVAAHLERLPVQLGASYPLSREALEAVRAGRAAAARLVGAEPEEIVLGASSTVLVAELARVLRAGWREGDEVIVTNLDHEANVGPWRKLEESGIVVREWRFRSEILALHVEDLEPLLSERTRLVAFTHVSNVFGSIHDVARVTERVRAAGALSCVDGVAFAPHRAVDVRALGCDFYLVSLYKVYGPHLGLLFGRRALLLESASPNHFFVPQDSLPAKWEPGNVNYELAASLVGVVEYLEELDRDHGGPGTLTGAFARIAQHEEELVRPLLEFLDAHDDVRILGEARPDAELRVPTVSFTVRGFTPESVVSALEEERIAARHGHFYAIRAIRDLGLLDEGGVVRVSLVHYNSHEEVAKLIAALRTTLGDA